MHIKDLVRAAHTNAKQKGFWESPREFGTLIALIHSELSEALEADRKGDVDNLEEELADVVIRIADLCGGYGYDLEAAIVTKMERNKARAYKHGKAY